MEPVEGSYFDGQTARRHPALAEPSPDGTALRLTLVETGDRFDLPLASLRRGGEQVAGSGQISLAFHAPGEDEQQRDPARLVLPLGELTDWITAHAPALHRRDVPRRTWIRLAKAGAFATVALCALIFVIIPGLSRILADMVTPEQEADIGRRVLGQIEYVLAHGTDKDLTCRSKAGQKALEHLRDRLAESGMVTTPIELRVWDHSMINAFAAPGGQVVLLRGFLEAADSPDEVAAVLAHEIGHVEAGDPLREAFRTAGSAGILSLVFGDLTGGAAAALVADSVLSSTYSRSAEEQADVFALAMLRAAAISPKGFAEFFERVSRLEGAGLPEFMSSHPETATRRARATEAQPYDANPALDAGDWAALRAICG
ncbi:M48 family metallopeptidase [Gemmobacter denitrificans]|uniref:M48 family metallopeptidase n=1 Tax=Gemmobacter denitrificans TaxID=3123040 RepID=A0ABU8BW62_9RHOB